MINGQISMAKLLIREAKVNPDVTDRFKRTSVHWAARFNMAPMIKALGKLDV